MKQEQVVEIGPQRNKVYREISSNVRTLINLFFGLAFIAFIVVLTMNIMTMNHLREIQAIALEEIAKDQKTNNEALAVSNVLMAQIKAELRLQNKPQPPENKPNE